MSAVSHRPASDPKGVREAAHLEIRPDAFRFPSLPPARSAEHHALHIAALEWSLDAPITIRTEADILSRREWAERFQPYAHQVQNLITFCRRAPVALLADDVGLGKTISAGLILSELMVRRKVSRALVVAPKLLVPQWQEELATKFAVAAATCTGADLPAAFRGAMPVVVTTYQSVRAYLRDLRHANFDMVILDEAHKLRNLHGTSKPPQFAQDIRRALADRVFKYVLMLTATPIQNRLWDIYSLLDLLTAARGHEHPLGTPSSFRDRYLADSRAVDLMPGRRDEFRRHLGNYIARVRREDAGLQFPSRRVKTRRVPPGAVERRLFAEIGELFRTTSLNGLVQSSIGQALMSSPQALVAQLEEMASRDTVPRKVAERAVRLVAAEPRSAKLEGLATLIQQLASQRPEDWRLVVFTSRRRTQQAIEEHLNRLHFPVGLVTGGSAWRSEQAIRGFRESPPRVRVLVSTDAGAEGINLQIANVLVNYDLPWNPMVMEQRIGRIQRLASAHAEVIVLNLVLAQSVEETVVARLSEKLQAIATSLGDMEAILESAGHAGEDEESFEAMIRRLVVDSLKGADVARATQQAMESIEDARRIFEAEKETVERTLGNLTNLHRTGPRVPEIMPVEPSIEARDFVLRALTRDGARIRPLDADVLSVTLPGQNEFRMTFKERAAAQDHSAEAVFAGNAVRLFTPGKRDFERLAQSWCDKAAAIVVDRSECPDSQVEQAVSSWVASHDGAEVESMRLLGREASLAGVLTVRASVAVAHDRLEKLVQVPIGDWNASEVESPGDEDPLRATEVESQALGDDLRSLIEEAVRKDVDMDRFARFYVGRREEELAATADSAQARRVHDRFSPVAAADAVAFKGVQCGRISVAAWVRIDGEGPYAAHVVVTTGGRAGPQVSPTTPWARCQATGRAGPEDALELCETSAQVVLKHLLGTSAMSGRRALRSLMVRCELSGEDVLPTEIGTCAITGMQVRADLLAASAVSGRCAIRERMAHCSFTGVLLLPDEVQTSDVSSRLFRPDQSATSVLSGRRGHLSEFVESVDPVGLIASDEAAPSAVSGQVAARDRMIESQGPGHRLGLATEAVTSAVSGKRMLVDEAVASDVSGALALPSELGECSFTAAKATPDELFRSEISGRLARRDELQRSVVSQRCGHRSEFVQSVAPTGWIAVDEAATSDVSGERGHRDQVVTSGRPPHRRGFVHETQTCEASGRTLLRDELGISSVSGRRVDSSLLVSSVASGRLALAEEMVACEATGARLLPDEVGTCAITGKRVDLRELARSEVSAAMGLARLMKRCAATGRLTLPSELVKCSVSGDLVLPDQCVQCAVTGRRVALSHVKRCPTSDVAYVDDAMSLEVVRARTGASSLLGQCEWTGRWMLALRLRHCTLCGLLAGDDMLNAAGELLVLRTLLDGAEAPGASTVEAGLLDRLRTSSPSLRGARDGRCEYSRDRLIVVAALRVKVGTFGLSTAYCGVAVRLMPQFELCSTPVSGRRGPRGWVRDPKVGA